MGWIQGIFKIGMLLHALETIWTYEDSKLGQNPKILTWWTHLHPVDRLFWIPSFGLLVHERSQIFTAAVNIDRTKREFVTNLSLKGSYMTEK